MRRSRDRRGGGVFKHPPPPSRSWKIQRPSRARVKDIVPDGVTVNTPAYLFQPQFTKQEVMYNREVAEARVHVERAIQRLKYYTILDGIPHQYRNVIDDIVHVCAFLTTAQSPIISNARLSDMSPQAVQ